MNKTYFKIIQRRLRYRNPNSILTIPKDFQFSKDELKQAQAYIEHIQTKNINSTCPGESDYPISFYYMKEPPLFLEYLGPPVWLHSKFISVVGSRSIHPITESWMRLNMTEFLNSANIGVVSGGAIGVDQLAHLISLKDNRPTVFVLPSGLEQLYPKNLLEFQKTFTHSQSCFLTEFELNQKIHKSHFYFRNRLIAALGEMMLVTQASLKSGSLLSVHHCLENGRAVIVVPAHPELLGFEGNLKLLKEGAYPVVNKTDLLEFWRAEIFSK